MATINSVSVYLSRVNSHYLGWTLYCRVYLSSSYTTNPTVGLAIGNSSVWADDIPVEGGWVTFTFTTPLTIAGNSFYTIRLWGMGVSDYDATHLRWHGASDFIDATTGLPYNGKERAWDWDGYSWVAGNTRAFIISTTGCVNNEASAVTETVYDFSHSDLYYSTHGQGVKAYIAVDESTIVDGEGTIAITSTLSGVASLLAPPPKATNPSPSNTAGNCKNIVNLTWELEE